MTHPKPVERTQRVIWDKRQPWPFTKLPTPAERSKALRESLKSAPPALL